MADYGPNFRILSDKVNELIQILVSNYSKISGKNIGILSPAPFIFKFMENERRESEDIV